MFWEIKGSVCTGYTLHHPGQAHPGPWHFTNMWDAILTRERLNSGEWTPGERQRVEVGDDHPALTPAA